jgi:hypothetical protein
LNVTLPAGIIGQHCGGAKYLTQMGFKQPTPSIVGPLYGYVPNLDVIHCPADFRANLTVSSGYAGPYSWDSYSGTTFLHGEAASRNDPKFCTRAVVSSGWRVRLRVEKISAHGE